MGKEGHILPVGEVWKSDVTENVTDVTENVTENDTDKSTAEKRREERDVCSVGRNKISVHQKNFFVR